MSVSDGLFQIVPHLLDLVQPLLEVLALRMSAIDQFLARLAHRVEARFVILHLGVQRLSREIARQNSVRIRACGRGGDHDTRVADRLKFHYSWVVPLTSAVLRMAAARTALQNRVKSKWANFKIF